jgi:hypothetical protein
LAASSLSAIVAMPLMWANIDQLAETNGEIQGAADAIQDMADQFKDERLAKTPMSKWPSIQVPAAHLPTNPQPTVSQQAWRTGQITGRNNAVKAVADLEKNPNPQTLPDGKHIRVSGRLWLRAISAAFRDNAGVEVIIKPTKRGTEEARQASFPNALEFLARGAIG